jgi:2-oxoglutarate dehydrogenase E2 component (dihydrolipoamide succinyltransferase)
MRAATEIKVPPLGESVSEATVAQWLKKAGEVVQADEPIVELETDKVTLEVNAPVAGILQNVSAKTGTTVSVGDILGAIVPDTQSKSSSAPEVPKRADTPPAPPEKQEPQPMSDKNAPSVKKIAAEQNIDVTQVLGSGKEGRVTKGDLINFGTREPSSAPQIALELPEREDEEHIKMTRLRKSIATRLKEAQNTAAMLTTFNEVDMTNVMAARNQYKEAFEKKHGIKLGFMSFFVKAIIVALKEIPAVNGSIEGEDLVYKNHYDIGVAVSTPQGLVVPVVRDADRMGFADVEKEIGALSLKARNGKLTMQDLTGGTFTVTNGGTFGSLMSTPILNPPQSGILGMHKIQERPVALKGEVKIRPMMYLALTYDHRIIDGREAVTFLVRVKECIENPERILLDI